MVNRMNIPKISIRLFVVAICALLMFGTAFGQNEEKEKAHSQEISRGQAGVGRRCSDRQSGRSISGYVSADHPADYAISG